MNYSAIRARARESLTGIWALVIAVCLVAYILGGLIVGSTFLPDFDSNKDEPKWNEFHVTEDFTINLAPLALVQFILGGATQLGLAQFLLKMHDGEKPVVNDLFSQFHRFGQGFAQKFLRDLYSFLWALLFVIPGIVAHYRYAMTPFIMADHPELTASEAIAASCEMMDGHKGELFMLHLTFLGWSLLATVTLNLGHLVLNPYRNAAQATFYRELLANQKPELPPVY